MTSSLIQTPDQQPFSPSLHENTDCSGVALDLEKVWLNNPFLIHLDLLSPKGSPQLPDMLLSPAFQSSGPKSFLLSSPEPLLTLLSINSQDSPAGAPQTCFMENNGQDVPSPLWHDYSTREGQSGAQYFNRDSDAHASMTSQGPDALNTTCDGSSQIQTNGTLEEGLMIHSLWNISQNAVLTDQASRLQKRLLAMLGEHASRHYSHQLEGLRRKVLNASYRPKSPMASGGLFMHARDEMFNAVEMQEEDEVLRQIHQTDGQSLKSIDLENLAQCGRAVLHGVLDSLDSDATLSSSSDEEVDHEDAKGSSAASQYHGCEWKWLKERAELCSRWTWLQMRLTELDSQIHQLGELHKQILANRGHVVLAETQLLTDRQIQHTLWTETMDLSFTAGNMQDLSSDVDMEPSSPTRLLRNIERQSAQLTQIVNSLMPPFCASPSSSPVTKRPRSHSRDHQKIAFGSQVQANTAVSLPNGSQFLQKTRQKRKRVCHRRQCPLHITCVSARTRPLLTYHKPRLFIMNPSSHREQDSFCSLCLPCDPAATCPHRKEKTAGKVHSVLSLSSDTPSSLHLQNALCAENLHQRSFLLKSDLLRSQNCLSSRCRVSRSLFHCNQLKNSRHLKNHRRESTPIRWACTRDHLRKTHKKDKLKRRCSEWLTDVTHWSDVSSLSDENLVEEYFSDCTPTQQRHLQVERHEYKDILTPSWRNVDISPLLNRKEDELDEEVLEPITDEDFRQRHQSYEHKEKLRWSSWNLSRRHRSSKRSCSAVSVRDHPAHCHPPVDSPVISTWTSTPPEGQTEASVDDTEPVHPWIRRLFPLSDEDEDALRCDEDI